MSLGSIPMSDDAVLRAGIFVLVLVTMLFLERIGPARTISALMSSRWRTNLVVFLTGVLAVKLMGPIVAVNAAIWSAQNGFGLLYLLDMNVFSRLLLALLLLDAAIYWQHYLSHRIGFLWRFHRVHHADPSIDTSTALRFHPVEFVLSMLYKCVVVSFLGASWWAVVIFEILLNASAMFNHSNIKIPRTIERVLRVFVVTPRMHLVHHSVSAIEHHQNFGFCLSVWDRLFRTYLSDFRSRKELLGLSSVERGDAISLQWLIFSPFRKR